MEYNLISELQIPNRDWKIKGRIARLWDSINHAENDLLMSVDAYIVDEKGDAILATIKPENADHFKALLDEKDIYYFSNFTVFPIRNSYRPCPNEYMIKFDCKTKIEKTVDAANQFPPDSFHVISYNEMKSRVRNKVYLTDMIGQVLKAWPEEQICSNQRMVKLKKLDFEDEMMNKISATLWGELAMKFDEKKVVANSQNNPAIIILAGMMVSTFSGKIILSSTSASKIYIDLQIPEVEQLKRSRIIQPQTLQIMASSHPSSTNVDEQIKTNRRTVAELLSLDKNNDAHLKFTCRAKIRSIDVSDGWWYASCPICSSTTSPWKSTNVCSQCSVIDQAPIPCYILNATVEDETGHALFTIFDRQAEKLIGISAAAITSMKGSNRYVLPQMIADIFPIFHIFQVAINLNNKRMKSICFKVSNIFTDLVDSRDKSDKLLQTSEIDDKQTDGKTGQIQSDMLIHTPERLKSIPRKRLTQQIMLEDSDASTSDDQPLAISMKRIINQKKRATISIGESCQENTRQKKSEISSKKKRKKVIGKIGRRSD